MEFLNDFHKASYKERLAFKTFLKVYPDIFPTESFIIGETMFDGNDPYDFLITKHYDGSIEKRYIIEIKVRSDKWLTQCENEGFFFEKKKYNQLKLIRDMDPDNNRILYINFTSRGTYFWNIDRIESDFSIKNRSMNKTNKGNTQAIDKDVIILSRDISKTYNFNWCDEIFDSHIKSIKRDLMMNSIMKDSKSYKNIGFQI